jgi:hypothetical protein
MEGCEPSFLEKLPTHLTFISGFFQSRGLSLDNTLEQLKEVERFIAANRENLELHTAAFFQGLVAYCGELIRINTPGTWQLQVSKVNANHEKEQYFPIIADETGRHCPFSGEVEFQLLHLLNPDLRMDKMRGLYYTIALARMEIPRLPIDTQNMPLPF